MNALEGREQDDCRWTPCFDCGVCPDLGTAIQIGPTGRRLLPLTPVDRLAAVAEPTGTGGPAGQRAAAAASTSPAP